MRSMAVALAVCAGVALVDGTASAEVVRFHYGPADACGNVTLVPGPKGAPAERAGWLGGPASPFYRHVLATHVVTFRHSFTCRNVNVPITFPDGSPRVETLSEYVQFNFTSYMIRVTFLRDGSVDVLYNSGWFRPIAFQ